MKLKGKLTIAGLVGFAAATVGIASGLPQAIANVKDYGPQFVSDPNFWWIAFCAVVTGVVMLLIWLPWRKHDRTHAPDSYWNLDRHFVLSHMERFAQYCVDLAENGAQDSLAQHIRREIEIVMPRLLETYYGKKERTEYVKAIEEAKEKMPGDTGALARVYVAHVGAMVTRKTEKEIAEARENTRRLGPSLLLE